MLASTIIMAGLAIVLIGIAITRGQHVEGARAASRMLLSLLPLLVLAFTVAGFVQVLLPAELVSRWLGAEAGWRGIMIGSAAGAFCPGGPFVSLPIVAGLFNAGTGVGTLVAFLTAWSLWSVNRLPMEVGILGWELTLIRLASTLIMPPIAGWVAQTFFGGSV